MQEMHTVVYPVKAMAVEHMAGKIVQERIRVRITVEKGIADSMQQYSTGMVL